jgi:GNAT superfamily N-acetyltransferase
MVPLAVRRATAGDATAVAGLVNRAYVVERFFIDGDRTSVEDVGEMMTRGLFLVAEENGTLVASVYVEVRGRRGYFGLLSVDPSRQGQGFGRLLVDEAEAHCRAAGCEAMDILVVDLRSELPPFYRRLGYSEVGSEPFSDPERAKLPCRFIVMRKPLA